MNKVKNKDYALNGFLNQSKELLVECRKVKGFRDHESTCRRISNILRVWEILESVSLL
jgi:hypothetical protein